MLEKLSGSMSSSVFPMYRARLVEAYKLSGRTDSIIPDFEKAVERFPSEGQVLWSIFASVCKMNGEYENWKSGIHLSSIRTRKTPRCSSNLASAKNPAEIFRTLLRHSRASLKHFPTTVFSALQNVFETRMQR